MLDDEKIKIANKNVNNYLKEGLMKKKYQSNEAINIFKQKSEESMDVAELIFEKNISDLWIIVISYYAMYYMANAILSKLGYSVGDKISHKVTSDALIVFVRDKLKNKLINDFEEVQEEALSIINTSKHEVMVDEIIEFFELERRKRSLSQYDTNYILKKSRSETSLNRSRRFILEIKSLLEE